jgi:CBS domain-containing protein
MGYTNRGYEAYGGDADYNEQRSRRSPARPLRRGYGQDYRGYTRGYNMDREPSYRTEYNTGAGARYDENYGRDYSRSDRQQWREAGFNQGPRRSHLRCRDIMTRDVTTCHRDTPIIEVARIMRDEDVGALPVLGLDGKLEGIVTDRDLIVSGLTSNKDDANLRAEDCMSDDLFTANQNDRIVDIINEMGDNKVRRVPVVDGRGRLVGIISMADVALHTNKDMELEDALEDISKPHSFLDRVASWFDW